MNIRSTGGDGGGRRELSQLPFVRRNQSSKPLSDADAPKLRRPILIAAFEGWNDAGEAASYAAGYLSRQWDALPFAEIDPDEVFDFPEVRPEVSLVDGTTRRILWPATSFSIARSTTGGSDLV